MESVSVSEIEMKCVSTKEFDDFREIRYISQFANGFNKLTIVSSTSHRVGNWYVITLKGRD